MRKMPRTTFTAKVMGFYRGQDGEKRIEISVRPIRSGEYEVYIPDEANNDRPMQVCKVVFHRVEWEWGVIGSGHDEVSSYGPDPIMLALDWVEDMMNLGKYSGEA